VFWLALMLANLEGLKTNGISLILRQRM